MLVGGSDRIRIRASCEAWCVAIASLASVEPPSRIMNSKSAIVWARILAIVSSMNLAVLSMVMTTLTTGVGWTSGAELSVNLSPSRGAGSIWRLQYYTWILILVIAVLGINLY